MSSRSEIRTQLRQRRRQLSASAQQQATAAICSHLAASAVFNRSQRIAGFMANENEPDLLPLMQLSWARAKQWHLPIIGLPFINHLWFAPYRAGDTLLFNRYGIAEPAVALKKTTPSRGLDLVLMPLVAFDTKGNRLGMGKGYYDRTLKHLRLRQHWRKPRLIGVAYEFQKIAQLPFEPWDIPLDGVVTEKQFYRIKQ